MKVIKTFFVSILILLVTVNIILVFKTFFRPKEVPGIFGYKPLIVLSGSMSPTFNYGDMIVVKDVDTGTLKKGDIVSFKNSKKTITTHRINNIVDGCYETKGDANNSKDVGVVCPKDVVGKYSYKVPVLGTVIMFIQTPIGFIILMSLLILICINVYLYEPKKKKEK